METLIQDVNWLAVVVGAVVAFAVGGLWYSKKLFGTKWAESVGINTDDGSGSMGMAMLTQATGTFLLAWVIGVTQTTGSLMLAVLIAVTISVLMKAGGLFTQRSTYAIAVDSSYVLVMAAVMIAAHMVL